MQKNGKFQGGHCTFELTGNPGGSTSKKSISSTGVVQFFSGKVQCQHGRILDESHWQVHETGGIVNYVTTYKAFISEISKI